jgi:hypothetical protein
MAINDGEPHLPEWMKNVRKNLENKPEITTPEP